MYLKEKDRIINYFSYSETAPLHLLSIVAIKIATNFLRKTSIWFDFTLFDNSYLYYNPCSVKFNATNLELLGTNV